jgi:leucyl aminopeptidase (aminopeptidase T)
MEEKKPRKKRSPFKHVPCKSTFGAVDDAFNALEELASECREVVDNASEGLSQTERIQALDETAGTLESITAVEVPTVLQERELEYVETVPTDKRRSPSRATRRDNAVAVLHAAHETAMELFEDAEFKAQNGDDWESLEQELQQFCDGLDEAIGEAEGCEFPGMFG